MEIKRDDLLNQLIQSMNSPLIKVIIGPRRSGKSYLLFHLFTNYLIDSGVDKDHIISINLDSLSNAELRNPIRLSAYIRKALKDHKKYYVMIDEIQDSVKIVNPAFVDANGQLYQGISEEEKWLTYHDVLSELLLDARVDCYVTGSNSRLLSSDLPTEFRNRNYNIEVFPLSFKEIKEAFPEREYDELWDEYVIYGGMPLAVISKDVISKQKYLKDLFEGTYFKDIKERYHLKDNNSIDKITDIVASSIGSPLNPGKIEKTLKSNKICDLSDNTIANYLRYLENAFLIKEAKRYDVKGRKYIGTLNKYYFIDSGLRNARLNFRQVEQTHLMECIIYNELCRCGYSVDVGNVETYSRDPDTKKTKRVDYEVDFVVNHGDKRYYIQSAFAINSLEKLQQEENSLLKINDSFKKIIIVKGYKKPMYNDNGIIIIGLYNFLMDAKSIEIL